MGCCDAMRAEMIPGDTMLIERSNWAGMTVRHLLLRSACRPLRVHAERDFLVLAFVGAGVVIVGQSSQTDLQHPVGAVAGETAGLLGLVAEM